MRLLKNGDKCQKMSTINIIKRGEVKLSTKKKMIIICLIMIVIGFVIAIVIKQNKQNKRADVKIPVLLYHDFVKTGENKPCCNDIIMQTKEERLDFFMKINKNLGLSVVIQTTPLKEEFFQDVSLSPESTHVFG